ncbi:hypothetical protein DACRYDRAFT_115666 [Dacryopinax primogenitus]|uniref:3-methylcrotonyl-CoA carboxylase n=1 Tax=Dacryopinax primogenitus (strain DJM 731) TaxID=1858805 RepID=M5G1P4_DACPD|nr:uncharacterized protein DACRYDRAFT_115666 [Dacryopinax primogenitus]EJU02634.1 hypothetical protein DACRYDRAFT_115666 [Dacryopinax primogenitus]
MLRKRAARFAQRRVYPEVAAAGVGGVRLMHLSTRGTSRSTALLGGDAHSWSLPVRGYATGTIPDRPPPRKPLFTKLLIANRGEIACRIIRTCRKLGISTIAVYSDADADALHVRLADEAFRLGPAPSAESYLSLERIVEVAKRAGAQAVHPGYGFLSENARFAERLAAEGLVFIGPGVEAIKSMGSKSESKDIMLAAGVPCVPGYHSSEPVPISELERQATKLGYPLLIKAVLGGGGKGMRIVRSVEDFLPALESAQREARKAFGDERVLIERWIERPRHVEVQVFGDSSGNVVSLWERDCSVQRRHQKIIEEAPAPGLSDEVRKDLSDKAVAAAKAVNYLGAGTVEFIFDCDTDEFYFMEMNTRLQVEHPVTEMITGQDLVQWQLEVASGNPLPLRQDEIPRIGHAFEARIYAENPLNDFLPDVGPLLYKSTPQPSESLRLEEGFPQGSNIEVYYDPLISKVVAHGRDRTEALRILRKSLEGYHIAGVSTNVEFLKALAGNKAFLDQELDTGFIAKHRDELFPPISAPAPAVLAQAVLFLLLREQPLHLPATATPWQSLAFRRFSDIYTKHFKFHPDPLLNHGNPSPASEVTVVSSKPGLFDVEVRNPGADPVCFKDVKAHMISSTVISSTLDAQRVQTAVVQQSPPPTVLPSSTVTDRLHIFHQGSKTTLLIPPPNYLLQIAAEALTSGGIRAPMPSLVVDVRVKEGEDVNKGQPVVVLESMKTEIVLRAEVDGKVSMVGCKKGDMVEEGKELITVVATD